MVHGFRATARTILRQELKIREDLIEHQLGHQAIDPNGRAYNRATFLAELRLIMQHWADYLDKLKSQKAVPSIKPKPLTAGQSFHPTVVRRVGENVRAFLYAAG